MMLYVEEALKLRVQKGRHKLHKPYILYIYLSPSKYHPSYPAPVMNHVEAPPIFKVDSFPVNTPGYVKCRADHAMHPVEALYKNQIGEA